MAVKGIDISRYQTQVDFAKVKASGIDFVIIRAGFGEFISQKDPLFESHYKAAKAAGLDVGAYWYSYAESADEARTEAQVCMEAIKGKTFEYPIYFDLEEQSQLKKGKTFCSNLVKAFCDEMEGNGYFAGLYMSRSPLQSYITSDVASRYALWIAEYSDALNYSGDYGMWQYTSTGNVSGIASDVDRDWAYVDYPSLIKKGGYNGFEPDEPEQVSILGAAKTSTAIRLKWKGVDCTGYKLQQYDTKSKSWKTKKLLKSSLTEYRMTGFKPDTVYRFRMQAYVKSNGKTSYGDWSKAKKVTTRK